MARSPSDDVEDAVRAAFGFLAERPGCKVQVEKLGRYMYTLIAYIFDDFTYEVYLEWKEPDVDVRLCVTIDGHPPREMGIRNGRRIRVPMHVALANGNERWRSMAIDLIRRIRAIPRTPWDTMMCREAELLADVLKEIIDSLPDYVDTVFPMLPDRA